jgi:glycosyltransferase involved in cell wall biosynthesis
MTAKPWVAVIVPTKNSAAYLEGCLRSIKNQSYPNIELVVVDNKSTDNTSKIAKKYADKFFTHGPERSAQRNYGAKKSKSEYLLIIDSDMELNTEVVNNCVKKMMSEKTLRAIVIPEESFGEGFWAQCKKLERSFYIGIDWMEAARFFDRKVFEEFNGYDENNTGTEDYDLPQRIESKYGAKAIDRVKSLIRHNEQRLSLVKTCRKKFYYSQNLDVYSSVAANAGRYKKQSSPLRRYALFFSNPNKLFSDPLIGLGMLYMKSCEFAFGGAGYLINTLKNATK